MLKAKEYGRVCYSLHAKTPHNTLDVIPLIKAFLRACKNSRIALRVEATSSTYDTIIDFQSPEKEFNYCSRIVEALITAELGDEISYSRISCSENFRIH